MFGARALLWCLCFVVAGAVVSVAGARGHRLHHIVPARHKHSEFYALEPMDECQCHRIEIHITETYEIDSRTAPTSMVILS
ncbi:unnamed protein product [Leptidea sinapis]|uniref:Secreted protein n=1 Tax=Leptidea sinapis TaxID=189913 RepID=A0A5E4QB48_9NEOP|nr:unnamed protein product [Leptidea sinapis]